HTLDAQVCNGGFAQYFVNSSGDHAHDTLQALAVVGATNTENILRRAMECFGPDGPSRDREERHDQVATLSEESLAWMDGLDKEYYARTDGLNEKLLSYVLAHAEHFQADSQGT